MPDSQKHLLPLRYIYRKAHRIILPGLHGASLFQVGKFFKREMKTLGLQERAAAVTYNFFMATPPTFFAVIFIIAVSVINKCGADGAESAKTDCAKS